MSNDLPPNVARLLEQWRGATSSALGQLKAAGFLAALFVGAHVARGGHTSHRLASASLVCAAAFAWGFESVRAARARRRLSSALDVLLGRLPEVRAKIGRAMALVEVPFDESRGSIELSRLHLERQLRGLPEEAIMGAAGERAKLLARLALGAAAVMLGAVALGPFKIVEGMSVMAARGGKGPLELRYLDETRVEIRPPDYLKQRERRLAEPTNVSAPYGSLVSFRGKPLHGGRRLLLTDGVAEVPFVDDGAGGVTARWSLRETVELRVVARLGDVLIDAGERMVVTSIKDEAPQVEVEGAPRVVRLLEEAEVPIVYRASDDHGLREVNLVLRAGVKEERRMLSKLDGETRSDAGGYQLRGNDRFVARSYLPVEVTVEARDNDPLTGPKWGKSPAITLMPPSIGEPESLRHAALVRARDALVDLLAAWLVAKEPAQGAPSADVEAFDEARRGEADRAIAVVEEVLARRHGGMMVPGKVAQFARKLVAGLRTRGGAKRVSHDEMVKRLEQGLVSFDRIVRALSMRDAQATAKKLSPVATEVGDGLLLAMTSPEDSARGRQRADAAMVVLDGGGKALSSLGPLGQDLGEIVGNDLRRIRRALGVSDLEHAELAARDLAGRLARPLPSFMGGGGGAAEGGGSGKASLDEQQDEADEEMQRAEQQALRELSQDHSGNIESVEQAMRQSMSDDERERFLEEARRHAEAVRKAVSKLPEGDPEGENNPEAQARELAQRMAEALDKGDAKEAVEAGKAALEALDEARREDPNDPGRKPSQRAEAASGKLSPEVRWAENALDELRKKGADKGRLDEAAGREDQMSQRARDMAKQGRKADSTMPQPAVDMLESAARKMQDAAKALRKGDAQGAVEQQREAHRMLEMAREANEEGEGEGDSKNGENGRDVARGPAQIPKAEDYRGPEDFRRRVTEGLARGQSPGLTPAVRRYAERLLR